MSFNPRERFKDIWQLCFVRKTSENIWLREGDHDIELSNTDPRNYCHYYLVTRATCKSLMVYWVIMLLPRAHSPPYCVLTFSRKLPEKNNIFVESIFVGEDFKCRINNLVRWLNSPLCTITAIEITPLTFLSFTLARFTMVLVQLILLYNLKSTEKVLKMKRDYINKTPLNFSEHAQI